MAERLRHAEQKAQFHTAVPHLHLGFALRGRAEQSRLGLDLFGVAADCHRLRNRRPVIEDQDWDALEGIDLRELGGLQLPLHEVDFLEGNREPFLCHEDANAARVGRGLGLEDFLHDLLAGGTGNS